MNIKFRQGWSDFYFDKGDIQFLRLSWDYGHILAWHFWLNIEFTILNFSIQVNIG